MRQCVFPECRNRPDNRVGNVALLHRFPRVEHVRRHWIQWVKEDCKMPFFEYTPQSVLCYRHFDIGSYHKSNGLLKPFTYPSYTPQYLDEQAMQVISGESPPSDGIQKTNLIIKIDPTLVRNNTQTAPDENKKCVLLVTNQNSEPVLTTQNQGSSRISRIDHGRVIPLRSRVPPRITPRVLPRVLPHILPCVSVPVVPVNAPLPTSSPPPLRLFSSNTLVSETPVKCSDNKSTPQKIAIVCARFARKDGSVVLTSSADSVTDFAEETVKKNVEEVQTTYENNKGLLYTPSSQIVLDESVTSDKQSSKLNPTEKVPVLTQISEQGKGNSSRTLQNGGLVSKVISSLKRSSGVKLVGTVIPPGREQISVYQKLLQKERRKIMKLEALLIDLKNKNLITSEIAEIIKSAITEE